MTDEEMAEEYTAKNGFGSDCNNLTSYDANKEIEQAFLAGLKAKKKRIEKVKYTLKKIIETVQNDRIDEYGARHVLIKDFAYECLQEIDK